MFSTMFGSSELTENIVNVDQILRSLQNKGYSFFKTRRQLESGLSSSSLMVQKSNLTIIMQTINNSRFAMKLGMRNIICACYHKSRLILQRELEYEQQIVDLVEQAFNNIKQRKSQEQNKVENQLQKLRSFATKNEKNYKNFIDFSQQMKLSNQYRLLLNYQKEGYEKIINDSQFVIDNKKKIKNNNQELLNSLLQIEQNKQSLQNIILAYEDQRQYLSNSKSLFEEIIEQKKKKTEELSLYILNDTMFRQYLEDLVEVESLKIKLKTSGL